ncbi:MAG: preprotein translocase subunit YajC [Chloroflexi bacterium]|nr:preprotein translocase subunit YajC [Chloroflexota bacterium]
MGTQGWAILIMLVVFALAFYLLLMRPQQNQRKRQEEMMLQFKPGDKIFNTSGIIGTIVSIDEMTVVVETENGAEIRMLKGGIAGYVNTIPGLAEPQEDQDNESAHIESADQENK